MSSRTPYRLFPLSFSITGHGILYLSAILLLSIAVIRTSNNLLFLILATLISAFVVSSIVSRNSLKQVAVSIQVPENVFAGEHAPVNISVTNEKHVFPSFSICVENTGSNGGVRSISYYLKRLTGGRLAVGAHGDTGKPNRFLPSAYFPVLRPGETLSQISVQSFQRRGLVSFENLQISTRFPFGLFRHTERIRTDGEILIYPAVKDMSEHYHRIPFLRGLFESIQKGQGENLFSIRPYIEGESARVIDWKAAAKTGQLMSREFSREEESRICLILDTQTCEEMQGSNWEEFEKAVSLCASIAVHFISQGAGMEFMTPYSHIPYGTGYDHLHGILRSLAAVDFVKIPSRAQTPDWKETSLWSDLSFPGIRDGNILKQVFSDNVFKIVLTSKNANTFPSMVRTSSHLIFFDEL